MIADEALNAVVELGAGQPVNQSVKLGAGELVVDVVKLPNGPVAPYQEFSGKPLAIFELALVNAATFAAGGQIAIAEKVGDTWYGETLQYKLAAASA